MILNILLLITGFVILIKGSDFFIEGASSLALKAKIPPIIIGLSVVAMGTSAPEAAISIASGIKGATGILVGNILGSNIANILLVLGLSSLFYDLAIQKNTSRFEIPFVIFITLLMCGLGYFFGEISRLGALILIILFVLFLFYLFKMTNNINAPDDSQKKLSTIKIILYILGGLTALIYGSNIAVNSAVNIAQILNVSDRIIGLTIVAIGTSLPEAVVCVNAA